jgi:predicted transcriptional regulator
MDAAMEGTNRAFGQTEAMVMDLVWTWGRPVAVRDVLAELRTTREIAYTTVMTVMDRLFRKGWLQRQADGRAWRYEAAVSRCDFAAGQMYAALAASPDRAPVLVAFVDRIGAKDHAMLRQILSAPATARGSRSRRS